MRPLFFLLQQASEPAVLERDARRGWGDEAVDALLHAGVVHRGRAARYPCGGLRGPGCPRHIRADEGSPDRPLVAVCGRPTPACRPVPLTPEEASQLCASLLDLGRVVRRLLRLEGEFVPDDASMPHTVHLGQTRRRKDGPPLDVLLTRAAWWPGFAGMLAERMAHPRPTLVIAPTATHVRSDLVVRYAGPGRVRLAFLEEMLTVRGGELALAEETAGLTAAGGPAPFCRVLTERGERTLDRAAYDDLIARAPHDFDLVLDLVDTSRGRPATAWRRDGRGNVARVALTRYEAEALAELVARGVPTRARDLACLKAAGLQTPAKVVQRARQKVDVRVARYAWRAFPTSGGPGVERAFQFVPPSGFRYACLLRP